MKATIQVTDTLTGGTIFKTRYNDELQAQDAFDAQSETWSEFEARYAMDLIAHHPTNGDLIRRTMYTNN